MRLFLYGTLLNPTTLAACGGQPGLPRRSRTAVLRGWRRVKLARLRGPTLRRDPRGVVGGWVLPVGAAPLRRLKAWEGPEYRLQRVLVETSDCRVMAWTWIAPGGTQHPWI